jgi:hypothetical protein
MHKGHDTYFRGHSTLERLVAEMNKVIPPHPAIELNHHARLHASSYAPFL